MKVSLGPLLYPLRRQCYQRWLGFSLPAPVGAAEGQDARVNEVDLMRLGGLGPLLDVDLGLSRLGRRLWMSVVA